MKKVILFTTAVLCALILQIALVFGTDGIIYYSYYEIDQRAFILEIAMTMIIFVSFVMFINYLNRLYDHVSGFTGKRKMFGRWARTTMLAGLVTFFIVALIMIMASPQIKLKDPSVVAAEETVCFLAVAAAVFLYAVNYHKTKDVGARIRDLMYANSLQKGRRYTLMVEKNGTAEDERIKINGIVHGEMRVGDEVYHIFPNVEEKVYRITGLEVGGQNVRRAKNVEVIVKLSYRGEQDEIPAYSIISDVSTYHSKISEGVNNTENPYLSGMLEEYTRFHSNRVYASMLYYSICHATYLTAGIVQNRKSVGDIMDVPQDHTDIGFSSVTQTGKKEQMLPVYTDWDALRNWKEIINSDRSVTILTTFPQLVEMLRNGFSGIVINPFGPRPYALTLDMVESIVTSEGYRKDFVLNKNGEK